MVRWGGVNMRYARRRYVAAATAVREQGVGSREQVYGQGVSNG